MCLTDPYAEWMERNFQEAAEVARVRRQAAEDAARKEATAGQRERAEAAQAAIIRDQLIDDLRFKDEVGRS